MKDQIPTPLMLSQLRKYESHLSMFLTNSYVPHAGMWVGDELAVTFSTKCTYLTPNGVAFRIAEVYYNNKLKIRSFILPPQLSPGIKMLTYTIVGFKIDGNVDVIHMDSGIQRLHQAFGGLTSWFWDDIENIRKRYAPSKDYVNCFTETRDYIRHVICTFENPTLNTTYWV